MKDVKEQKQNDNGEIIEMKQGQVIKIPKNSGKAWLTLFYSLPQEFVSKLLPLDRFHRRSQALPEQ